MKKSKIAQIGNPILRIQTIDVPINEIKKGKVQKLIKKLINTMYEYNGAGLAANQIFEKYRICVLEILNNSNRYSHLPETPLKILINPRITYINKKKMFSSYEGCLSVPNIRGRVYRSYDIKVEYYDENANFINEEIKGFQAIVYQHEIDHLDGFIFTDKVYNNDSLVTYDNYVEFYEKNYKQELINFFKE